MNHLQDLCHIFHKSLSIENCSTRNVLNRISTYVYPKPIIVTKTIDHSDTIIEAVEHSTKIFTVRFPEIKLRHHFVQPDTEYHVRTIFYRDGSCGVRLYRNKDWKIDRPKTDLLNFLTQLQMIDNDVILNFEKLIFQHI